MATLIAGQKKGERLVKKVVWMTEQDAKFLAAVADDLKESEGEIIRTCCRAYGALPEAPMSKSGRQ